MVATRSGMRHKDFGIWHTWTWAQLLAEVRAYAVGLARLGLARGGRSRKRAASRASNFGNVSVSAFAMFVLPSAGGDARGPRYKYPARYWAGLDMDYPMVHFDRMVEQWAIQCIFP